MSRSAGSRRRNQAKVEEEKVLEQEAPPRQCFGPACTKQSRSTSKYCSDKCGIELARRRLYRILPSRIREWRRSPSVAERNDRQNLEQVLQQREEVRQCISDLEDRKRELEEMLTRLKEIPIDPDWKSKEQEDDIDMNMHCVTCGLAFPQRGILKHMEKCFSKRECETSFGSIYKTGIQGEPVFCEYYDPRKETYCQRLRALCDEHNKEPKVRDDQACGCPLVKRVFEPTGEYCGVPKKKCMKHLSWERMRRAEIDIARMRQFMKNDQLHQREENIRSAIANRMGVMGLLLHSTTDHEMQSTSGASSTS